VAFDIINTVLNSFDCGTAHFLQSRCPLSYGLLDFLASKLRRARIERGRRVVLNLEAESA
jgi:hypothetical protein